MSKICRTCLRKTKQTFGVNHTLEFADYAEKISIVLRFCIPELYLGFSTNPEICNDCKESLKVAYIFKKKCLNTENILGNYLKTVRCTGRSVELCEVLTYLEDKAKEQTEAKKIQQNYILNAQDIISEWEDPPDCEGVNVDLPIIEVRQSAPNPTNSQNIEQISLNTSYSTNTSYPTNPPKEKGLFFNRDKLACILQDIIENDKKVDSEETPHANVQPEKSQLLTDCEANTDNFPKITSVFSLSEDADEKTKQSSEIDDTSLDNNVDNPGSSKAQEVANGKSNNADDVLQIKDEPLDVEINSERINLRYTPTDEDTLDASETASYENMRCDSSLQGIIDSLPEIKDCNQYVDVPDFVQINNFGLRELEELRQQQLKETQTKTDENKGSVVNLDDKIQNDMPDDVIKDNVALKSNSKPVLPETVYINGKPMVKYIDGYKFLGKNSALKRALGSEGNQVKYATIGTQENPECINIIDKECFKELPTVIYIGGKKYIKSPQKKQFRLAPEVGNRKNRTPLTTTKNIFRQILPKDAGDVQDFQIYPTSKAFTKADSEEAKFQLNLSETVGSKPLRRRRRRLKIVPVAENPLTINKRIRTSSNDDDKDVVVLFTHYTYDGVYVNDHDYLINPYKRNKILVEAGGQWLCMCYICHRQHEIYEHVRHMHGHRSTCKVCQMDLGTSYLLNVHVRSHVKPCKQCTEKVPYGLLESHEQLHVEEEMDYEDETKRAHHRKRKANEDESVYFPLLHTDETDKRTTGSGLVREASVAEDQKELVPAQEDSIPSRKRGRRSRGIVEETPPVETSYRVLRSKVRKSYNETDLDISDIIEEVSSGTGPP